jgi:RNA polymerase sigma factor (sigma-70 family)
LSGDRGALDSRFAVFVESVYPGMLRTARLLTGEMHAAEDLAQSALERVYLRWARHSEWASPRAYCRTVLVRQYATTRRRRWTTEVALQPTDELEQDDDDIAGSAARLDLEAALRSLPRDMRVVLVLRYFEDLSIDQTAEGRLIPPPCLGGGPRSPDCGPAASLLACRRSGTGSPSRGQP